MKILRPIAIVLTFAVTVIVIQRFNSTGVAPIPRAFANGLSLDGAIDLGRKQKKPVLILATADWCGPCQFMKREILSQPSISAQISRDFIPAYVDLDKSKDAAERLQVIGIPATLVYWDGKLVARMQGVLPHDSFQQWLAAARDQALSDHPFVDRAEEDFARNLINKIEANAADAAPGKTPEDPPSPGNPASAQPPR